MSVEPSASEGGFVSRDRVATVLQALLRRAQAEGITDEALSGVKARAIKCYRVEGKLPRLDVALSIASALGDHAVNAILAIIGYAGQRLEGGPVHQPMALVADCLNSVAHLAVAAADNRFDHTEMPGVTADADHLIEILTPFSSAGRR